MRRIRLQAILTMNPRFIRPNHVHSVRKGPRNSQRSLHSLLLMLLALLLLGIPVLLALFLIFQCLIPCQAFHSGSLFVPVPSAHHSARPELASPATHFLITAGIALTSEVQSTPLVSLQSIPPSATNSMLPDVERKDESLVDKYDNSTLVVLLPFRTVASVRHCRGFGMWNQACR